MLVNVGCMSLRVILSYFIICEKITWNKKNSYKIIELQDYSELTLLDYFFTDCNKSNQKFMSYKNLIPRHT